MSVPADAPPPPTSNPPVCTFAIDSPYLNEEIGDRLEAQLQAQSGLRAIKQKMAELVSASRAMADISNDLSVLMSAASNGSSRSSNGNGAASSTSGTASSHEALRTLSSVVAEVGRSNEALADTLQDTFLSPLDIFLQSKEMTEIVALHDRYKQSRAQHSTVLLKYLQSDFAKPSTSRGNSSLSSAEEGRAMEVVTQFKRYELDRFDIISRMQHHEQRQALDVLEACVAACSGLRVFEASAGSILSAAQLAHLTDLSGRVPELQAAALSDQVAMGRQRRDLESVVDSMIERVQYQLPQSNLQGGTDQHHPYPVDATFRDTYLPATPSSSPSTPARPAAEGAAEAPITEHITLSSAAGGLTRSLLSFGSSLLEGAAKTTREAATQAAALHSSSGMGGIIGGGGGSSSSSGGGSSSSGGEVGPRVPLSEVEQRMKALELPSEFDAIYSSLSRFEFFSQNVRRQGFVFFLKGKIAKGTQGWRREWLVLDETKLYLVREGFEMELLVNLEVCSVRDRSREYSFCLEIANANKSTVSLIFEGRTSFVEWLAALRASIEDRLGASSALSSLRPAASGGNISAHDAGERQAAQAIVDEIMQSSTQCSDCQAPGSCGWVSLSKGTLFCIECSGIHRSLGVHVSKVRSLQLDDLPEAELRYVLAARGVNAHVWESNDEPHLWAGLSRNPTTTAERDALIRAKYMSKRFMRRLADGPDSALDAALLGAVQQDDVPGAMLCLQQGACWNDKQSVVLQACEHGSLHCLVLLLVNAAEGDNLDIRAAIETVRESGHTLIVDYLSQRLPAQKNN